MSWVEVLLLWGLFASTLLVQIRLPIRALSANNLAVPLFALALVWSSRATLGATVRRYRTLFLATVAVYAWVWISSLNSVMPALSVRYTVKYAAYPFLGFCFLLLFERGNTRWTALRTAYAILVTLAAFGILEYWQPDFPFVALRGRLVTYPRVASLLLWPNQFGVLMAIGLALGVALQHAGQLRRPWSGLLAVPFVLASALSGSRNGWFVLVALLVILASRRLISIAQAVGIGLGFAFFLLTMPVPRAQLGLAPASPLPLPDMVATGASRDLSAMTSPQQTLQPRERLWRAALHEIRQHPLTGIGLEVFSNTIGPALTNQIGIHTHNVFLNIATELGLVGLALIGLWLWLLLRRGDPSDWATSVPLAGIALGQLFDCFTYDYCFMAFTFFFLAAYLSAPHVDR